MPISRPPTVGSIAAGSELSPYPGFQRASRPENVSVARSLHVLSMSWRGCYRLSRPAPGSPADFLTLDLVHGRKACASMRPQIARCQRGMRAGCVRQPGANIKARVSTRTMLGVDHVLVDLLQGIAGRAVLYSTDTDVLPLSERLWASAV